MTDEQIRAIVLGQVNAYSITWANLRSGSSLTKDTPIEAGQVTDLLIQEAQLFGDKLPFLMGAVCAESDFSTHAWAKNLLGANPTGTFAGTDWGIAEINGANLPEMNGMQDLTQDQMIAKAMDPAWAIPVVAQWYASALNWAMDPETQKQIDYTNSATDPKAKNVYWLAALSYNRGKTGALKEVNSGVVVAHPDHVASLCNHFSDLLGIAHFMPDAKGLNLPGQGVSGYAPLT